MQSPNVAAWVVPLGAVILLLIAIELLVLQREKRRLAKRQAERRREANPSD